MKLRPHHLIDIVTKYGHGTAFVPHPYGHAVHTIAERVLNDPDLEVAFVLAADDICAPCRYLRPDGRCEDILSQLDEPLPKQDYNDRLDARLFSHLGMEPGVRMTVRAFLDRVSEHTPGIEEICTHPGEQSVDRLTSLVAGLKKLRILG
jgi:hypothetical protein